MGIVEFTPAIGLCLTHNSNSNASGLEATGKIWKTLFVTDCSKATIEADTSKQAVEHEHICTVDLAGLRISGLDWAANFDDDLYSVCWIYLF